MDLLSSDFFVNRKELFDNALTEIEKYSNEELSRTLETFWNLHKGQIIHSIDWNRYPLILYQTICSCFGGVRLSNILRIIAQNYKASRSGMPDLLLWKLHIDENGTQTGEILFSEIKGPRDRLSPKQYLWIHKMIQNDIPVEVLHVKENK